MGGVDKAMLAFAGAPLIVHVLARLASPVVVNANGPPERFAQLGVTVLADTVAGQPGPLAGVLAAMEWAAEDVTDILSVPVDCPFIPKDLAARLIEGRRADGAELAFAASGGRVHPVVGLWPRRLAAALRHALVAEDLRKVGSFTARYRCAEVVFADPDPFFNVNRPEDLATAEALRPLHAD
jgi:molybdopterin-guanine dinucleotide biosynthesis protein A